LPKSIRKHVRRAKALIRRQAVDSDEAARKVATLVAETRAKFTSPA